MWGSLFWGEIDIEGQWRKQETLTFKKEYGRSMCINLQKYPRFISEKSTFQNDNIALIRCI